MEALVYTLATVIGLPLTRRAARPRRCRSTVLPQHTQATPPTGFSVKLTIARNGKAEQGDSGLVTPSGRFGSSRPALFHRAAP